jgi:HEAT repeats/PBS lyase HEAT-like repeat
MKSLDEPTAPEPPAPAGGWLAPAGAHSVPHSRTRKLWLAVLALYLVSFLLPVFHDRGILANHLGVQPNGSVYGWQAFVIGLVVRWFGWAANPVIWLGVFFLARRKPRVAAGAGVLAIVLGLTYLELLVGHSLLSPRSYSVGYFCWLASAMLLTAAGLGLRWFGLGRRLTIFAAASVAIGVALLVTTEYCIVVLTAPPSEATLADRLHSDDVNVRRTAARKLALDHNPELIPVFIEATKDPDDKVRQSVIGALGDIGPRAVAAVPTLISTLSGPPPAFEKKADPKRAANSRSEAAAALGKIGPTAKEAVPALVAGLKDENVPVRRWSATSLGEMRTEGRSAVPALVQALHDPDAQVRRYAIQSLQKIGIDHDSLPALTPSLHDSDDTVRETAATLLKSPNKAH